MNDNEDYPESITKSIQALCDELVNYYPDILTRKYNQDSMNDWDNDKPVFLQKMEVILFIELIRAGYLDGEEI